MLILNEKCDNKKMYLLIDNKVRNFGGWIISEALKVNSTLTSLNLKRNSTIIYIKLK